MSAFIIRIIGLPAVPGLPDTTPHDGQFLTFYDPDDGWHGLLRTSPVQAEARRFADLPAVFRCWRQINTNHPLRDDGKPNRPLTAFSIEPIEVAE